MIRIDLLMKLCIYSEVHLHTEYIEAGFIPPQPPHFLFFLKKVIGSVSCHLYTDISMYEVLCVFCKYYICPCEDNGGGRHDIQGRSPAHDPSE